MKMTIKKTIFYLSVLLGVLVVLIAGVGYSESFIKYFKIPFYICALFALLPAVVLGLQKQTDYPNSKLFYPHLILFALGLLISVASVITEFYVYPNYFYSQFHLNPYTFYFLPLLLYFLFLFYREGFKKHWRWFAFFGPILFVLLGFLTKAKAYGIFANIFAHEDSWVEYTQFIFYLVSGYLSIKIAQMLKKRSQILFVMFLLIACGFFLIAGEEISWGQRILGIDTPEEIAELNTQGEFNIHNHHVIFGYVYAAYMILSAYAASAWILKLLVLDPYFKRWQNTYDLFIPRWQWSSAFAISFVIFYLHRVQHFDRLQIFEEFNELILSWGLIAFISENYWREKKKSINS